MLDEKDRDEIKEIIIGSLEESGLTAAARKLNSPELTKEDILSVKDRTTRQRLMAEHMDLFQ